MQFLTDVSGQPIYPIFKVLGPRRLVDCPETSVSYYHYSLRNNSEERSSQLYISWIQTYVIT